jgi:HD superfamily phosphohydrolase
MFRKIYSHRVSKAIELMIVDILMEAGNIIKQNAMQIVDAVLDQCMKISESVDDPEKYLYLTDDILCRIERSRLPELEQARLILKKVRTRKLYKFADEFLILLSSNPI